MDAWVKGRSFLKGIFMVSGSCVKSLIPPGPIKNHLLDVYPSWRQQKGDETAQKFAFW